MQHLCDGRVDVMLGRVIIALDQKLAALLEFGVDEPRRAEKFGGDGDRRVLELTVRKA